MLVVSIIQPPVSVYAAATLPQPLQYLRLSPISQSTNDFHQLFRSPIEYVTRTYPSILSMIKATAESMAMRYLLLGGGGGGGS